jgi:nodulation protein F
MADQLATDIIEKIRAHADAGMEVGPESDLTKLGIHSLELTEIVFDLEETYGIDIDMNTVEAWSNLRTVGDIVEATRALIAAKAA